MTNIEAISDSNLLPPGFPIGELTRQDVSDRQYGSKIVIVVEQMQIAVIWGCKTCLLVLYYRLTRMVNTKENLAIKLLAVYVAFGFILMEILYFAVWCRPFHDYWAIPAPSSQCDTLIDHRITNAVFNISSDIIMLCIALPMFIRSMLPLKRKLILCCIFSLGIFVILAALLNKYYSFVTPYQPTWIYWYVRESSTAILVANLPFTWTLLRKLFNLGAFDDSAPPPSSYHSARTAGGRYTQRHRHTDSGGTHHHGTEKVDKTAFPSSQHSGQSKASHTNSSGFRPSDSPLTIKSEKSDAPLVSWMDEDLESGREKSDSWDLEAQRVLLAEPKKVQVAPSIASSSMSWERKRAGGGGGGGGGRSASDRKIRAKISG